MGIKSVKSKLSERANARANAMANAAVSEKKGHEMAIPTHTHAGDPQQDPIAKRKVVNRLRRAHGQLAAVIDSAERSDHCRDIVQQLSAASKAVDRARLLLISNALRSCILDPASRTDTSPEELEELFLSPGPCTTPKS